MASISNSNPDHSQVTVKNCTTCGSVESCAHRSVGGSGGIWAILAISLVFLTVGLWVGAGGIYSAHQDHKLISNGVHSVGKVTEVKFKPGRRTKEYTIITVPFIATDGKQYSAEGADRYRKNQHGSREERTAELIDSEQTVFYDPDDPNKSVIEGKERPYLVPIILLTLLGGIGAFGFLIALFGFIGQRQFCKGAFSPPSLSGS